MQLKKQQVEEKSNSATYKYPILVFSRIPQVKYFASRSFSNQVKFSYNFV